MAAVYFSANQGAEAKRGEIISQKQAIIGELIAKDNYSCCLEKPCSYCLFEDSSEEGAACDCLDEVVNGEHPCGECIGEILEGKGNKFLAKYFAGALADEIGVSHLETLRQIISEKYGIGIKEQL